MPSLRKEHSEVASALDRVEDAEKELEKLEAEAKEAAAKEAAEMGTDVKNDDKNQVPEKL